MDSYTWLCQCWPTNEEFSSVQIIDAVKRICNGWLGLMVKEGRNSMLSEDDNVSLHLLLCNKKHHVWGICLNSSVHLSNATLCLLYKARGGITRKQRKKIWNSRTERLESLTDGEGVTLNLPLVLLLSSIRPAEILPRKILADYPGSRGASRLNASATSAAFSDQLTSTDSPN